MGSKKGSKKIAWSYTYPCNKNNEVMNMPIQAWQDGLQTFPKDPQKALCDFQRNITIQNQNYKKSSKENIIAAIDSLVDQSRASNGEKGLYKQWLMANGGQAINRFLDFLVAENHLLDPPEDPKEFKVHNISNGKYFEAVPPPLWILYKTNGTAQNWNIDKGKICFDYSCDVMSLSQGTLLVKRDKSNHVIRIPITHPDFEHRNNNPLLQVSAKIELDIVDNKVTPKITFLQFTSFTNVLKSPKRLRISASLLKKTKKTTNTAFGLFCRAFHPGENDSQTTKTIEMKKNS